MKMNAVVNAQTVSEEIRDMHRSERNLMSSVAMQKGIEKLGQSREWRRSWICLFIVGSHSRATQNLQPLRAEIVLMKYAEHKLPQRTQ